MVFSVNNKLAAECTAVGKQIAHKDQKKKYLCLKQLIIHFQKSFFALTCLLKEVKQFKIK